MGARARGRAQIASEVTHLRESRIASSIDCLGDFGGLWGTLVLFGIVCPFSERNLANLFDYRIY